MNNKLKSIIRNVISLSEETERVERLLQVRAFEHYIARGSTHGHDLEDWFAATDELIRRPEVNISETETEIRVNFTLSEKDLEQIQLFVTDSAILIAPISLSESDKQVFSLVQFSRLVDGDSVRLEYGSGVLTCTVKVAREAGRTLKAIA